MPRARRLIALGGAIAREELLLQLARSEGRQLLGIATERGDETRLLAMLAMLAVESALEAETLKVWRQLVHVLTHEIMNSLTSIASLSRTALEMQGDPEQAQDLTLALEAVARRAESLARFVADYRRVSDWPEPKPEPVPLQALFDRVERLVGKDWRTRGRRARFEVTPPSLLNLIKNAFQARQAWLRRNSSCRPGLYAVGVYPFAFATTAPGVPVGWSWTSSCPSSVRTQAGRRARVQVSVWPCCATSCTAWGARCASSALALASC